MKPWPDRPILTLLTDFGTTDHYVGAMKGVIVGICPQALPVDISHDLTPYAISEAAYTLAQAWACFPAGTVHLIVVDPGVGSARRPVLAEAAGHYFVAPDNGVLSMLYTAEPAHTVRHITQSRYFRHPVSRTFHGRDIFAPVAAHLAAGVGPNEFGERIADYQRLDFAQPVSTGPNTWRGTVLKVDHFGNLITNFPSRDWARLGSETFELKVGTGRVNRIAINYSEMEPASLYAITGSTGYLEISCNQASAAVMVGVRAGDPVEIRLLALRLP